MAQVKIPLRVVIDYETLPIEGRPHYPPCPVGVSIKWPGKKPRYWAWGHLFGNNCSWGEAQTELRRAYSSQHQLLFQNGKFDLDVGQVHMGLTLPPWERVEDTMFLLFLDDPHQRELGLKPSAERLLGTAPDERDAVVDWLMLHQPLAAQGIKLSEARSSERYAGAYVAFAPGTVTGPYANGDTQRTDDLFNLLWPKTQQRGMGAAYDRERELMPILLEMERQGIRIDIKRLEKDVHDYTQIHASLSAWIKKKLKTPELNLDSGVQLINALVAAKIVDETTVPRTGSGRFKSDKATLDEVINDKVLKATLRYVTQLGTCLRTFMGPWLAVARDSGGLIYTTWHQTRGAGDEGGTRTGRLSSTPNFQNIPKVFAPVWQHHQHLLEDQNDKKAVAKLAKCPHGELLPLPQVRGYIIPYSDGDILIDRDYSQQELRILGHFEDGALMERYLENPWMDVHDTARELINGLLGTNFGRKPIKNTGFGLIYGMGLGKLAIQSDTSVEEAKKVRDGYLATFPGLKAMYKEMKTAYHENRPIRTWGGREYYCEPAKIVDGRIMHFDYKLLNVLIQGSAADCTKQAIINYHRAKPKNHRILLNVHDQITASVPKKQAPTGMETLRKAMEAVKFDVPMLSEGSVGETWVTLRDYDKKGSLV